MDEIEHFTSVAFSNTPFGVFPVSNDFYGDGSIILVPLEGHTNGSLGMFVTLQSGKRLFFVGDVVWSAKQVERLRPKQKFGSKYVDLNKEKLNYTITLLHQLSKVTLNLSLCLSTITT